MKQRNFYILISVIIAIVVIFFIFNKKDDVIVSEQNEKIGILSTIKNFSLSGPTAKLDKRIYTNETYNFSFEFDEGVNVTSFKEGEEGDIILVKKSDENLEFQIFISEFDEEGPITPTRIKQDLPNLIIKNPQNVTIGSDSITALIFESKSEIESFGATREIWFVKNRFLYQITAALNMDNFIGSILETLKFN